ncbi:MAG: hypothetical protein KY468_00525 [Armatimonadetes bacterium]|nr:hypothetical protein [Armatimonadota bacterium]
MRESPILSRLHLAVMKPGPLRRLISGEKRIESRFSLRKSVPHGQVSAGDGIFFKESAGPVRAFGIAGAVATGEGMSPEDVQWIRALYNRWIVAEDEFWNAKRMARWATLISLQQVRPLPPLNIPKRNRCPWIVLGYAPHNGIESEARGLPHGAEPVDFEEDYRGQPANPERSLLMDRLLDHLRSASP